MDVFEIVNSELLKKTQCFIMKVARGTGVAPTRVEIPWKYECLQNHELGICKKALFVYNEGGARHRCGTKKY